MLDNKTSLQFVSYEKVGDHIEYKIIIKNSDNKKFELQARYRVLRNLFDQLKESTNPTNMPDFPPKKLFGNMNIDFVEQRKKGLENFFNNLLQRFSMNELEPLKNFFNPRNASVIGDIESLEQPQPIQETQKTQVQEQKDQRQSTNVSAPKFMVENYTKLLFDLNDNFARYHDETAPEMISKKQKYQKNIKIEVDSSSLYKMPNGDETNLITVQDQTLIANNSDIVTRMSETLDKIKEGMISTKTLNAGKFVFTMD